MRLLAKSSRKILIPNLEVANSTWTRTKGLLGRPDLAPDQALWIPRCNNIHTFFMKFALDLVFLNKKMVVTKIVKNVPPGRIVWAWTASSVIEFKTGFLEKTPVQVGEELHVDPSLS